MTPEAAKQRRKQAIVIGLAALAGAVATLAVGGGVLWLTRSSGSGADGGAASSETSTGALAATPATTEPAPPEVPGEAAEPPQAAEGGKPSSARHDIAFRLGDSIYSAPQDGGVATLLLRAQPGKAFTDETAYALSPDGKKLAVIDRGMLALLDTKTLKSKSVGVADAGMRPVWSNDAKTVFVRRMPPGASAPEIWRASASGSGYAKVRVGGAIASSGDAKRLAVIDGDRVLLSRPGGGWTRSTPATGVPTAIAIADDRLLIAYASGLKTRPIWSVSLANGSKTRLVSAIPGDVPAVWSRLLPSPDGRTVALQCSGDDGYTRAFVVSAAGGVPTAIVTRSDTALHAWSRSGDRLFILEGNAFQGESLMLSSVSPAGADRKQAVSGVE